MEQYNQNREEQEVDLVPVFVWISNGFRNFFRAIGAFFKGIGHAIILFFVYLQRNIILIGIFLIAGLALGFYLDSNSKSNYAAQLRVSPNFRSAAQLISNINYYNSLAEEEEYARLSQELGITQEQAADLKSFAIKPSYNDTELLKEYDKLARSADTMALDNFTFNGFKDAKREIDYEFYEITARSKSRANLELIMEKLVAVKENAGIKAARFASLESISFNIQAKRYQLSELDSLIVSYQKMISSNQSNGSSTNLYLSDSESTDKLMNLFTQKQSLLYQLELLREDQYASENIVNIESQYIVQGTIKNTYIKYKVLLAFFLLGILVAALPTFWRFLRAYPTTNR